MLATTQSLVVAHGALSHFYYEKLSQKIYVYEIINAATNQILIPIQTVQRHCLIS